MRCLDLEQLELYLSSDGGGESQPAGEHLAVCESCSSRLHELRENQKIEAPVRALVAAGQAVADTGLPRDLGAYRLLRELGRGGMGVVYEAEQRAPQRRVALKLLRETPANNGNAERLLRRETSALARLNHAGIASVYEAGHAPDGRAFFAMELVSGEPLIRFAERCGLSVQARLELFATVCETVAYAHLRGVIHRDLKPSNVLIQPDGRPKVLDFGLARIPEDELAEGEAASCRSEAGRVFGTLPYMSPEHVRGNAHAIDVRSDVYSLGVVLYELLTGRLPYSVWRDDMVRSAAAICDQPPQHPRTHAPRLPADAETIVLKSLEKCPERRYASAAELAADVRRFLRNEPIVARQPTLGYQIRMFAARNRALTATLAIASLGLLATTAAAVNQAVVATRERDAAQRRLEMALQSANYLFLGAPASIAKLPGNDAVQRHMAEEAYVFYRRIADEASNDPDERAGLWASLRRLILLALEDGNLERARLLAERVRADVEQTVLHHPDDPRVQHEQMHVHGVLEKLATAVGDADDAERHAVRVFELARAIDEWYRRNTDTSDRSVWVVPDTGPHAGSRPPHLQARADWSAALTRAGQRALQSDDRPAAAQLFREALAVVDELLRTDPTLEPMYRRDTSEYAPLAGPILLRIGARPTYEERRAEILAGLSAVAPPNAPAGQP